MLAKRSTPDAQNLILRFNPAGYAALLEVLRRMPFSRASRQAKAGPGTLSPSSSGDSQSGSGEEPGSGPGFVALDRSRGFWAVIGYAAVFGVVLAVAGLAFLGLVKGGARLWFTLPKNPSWFSGHLWWVAVTAAAGVLVGVLRRVFRLPAKLPGTMKELRDERVEPSTVLKAVAVSLVSLAGGASLGPEDALGKMGGGLGTCVSQRRKLDQSTSATNALSGMSGAYGGLLSSPILATSFVVELARSGQEFVIPEGKTILQVLLDAGVDVDYSCELGICGACEQRVISGTPEHRDAILTEEEQASNTQVMICCAGCKSERLVLDL